MLFKKSVIIHIKKMQNYEKMRNNPNIFKEFSKKCKKSAVQFAAQIFYQSNFVY